jgi:hypothetical protein
LYIQKYLHDRSLYDDDESDASKLMMAEYEDCWLAHKIQEIQIKEKKKKKSYLEIEECDEFSYFKSYLIASYDKSREELETIIVKEEKIMQKVLMCKRVKIKGEDGTKEYIRVIY